MKQHLGVALGAKNVAALAEMRSENLVIINLAVERDSKLAELSIFLFCSTFLPTVFCDEHRLSTSLRRVNNRQAAVSKTDALVVRDPQAGPVRSPCPHV